MKALAAYSTALLLFLTACGGGSGSGGPRTFSESFSWISGNWQMTLSTTDALGITKTKTQSGFLVVDKNGITGNLLFTDIPCSQTGAVTGTVSDQQILLSVNGPGLSITMDGLPGSNFVSMSGDYTISTSPCGIVEVGTWKASLVQPPAGNFQGIFVSNDNGLIFPVTAQINQGPNTGASSASLSGSLTVTGSPCLTTVNISGLISGTSVVMNLLDSSGNQVGSLAGVSNTIGTQLVDGTNAASSGNYQVLKQAPHTPCATGDAGIATLTF